MQMCMVTFIFCQPIPLLHSIFLSYLLRDPSSFARGANIHPLPSLVSYQLFSPFCLTHPEGTPTDQVTYLHRRHQQHQPSRLIQELASYVMGNPYAIGAIAPYRFLHVCVTVHDPVPVPVSARVPVPVCAHVNFHTAL